MPDIDINAALHELNVLRKVSTALDGLDPDARTRALRWLASRYNIPCETHTTTATLEGVRQP